MARPQKSDPEPDNLLEQCAVLYAEQGMIQIDIAKELGISQSKVSRLLRESKEGDVNCLGTPLWRETHELLMPPDRRDKVKKSMSQNWVPLVKQLKQLPGSRLLDVQIYHTSPSNPDVNPSTWDRAAQDFGRAVAAHVHQKLFTCTRIGIGSGRLLNAMVQRMRGMAREPRNVTVVPLTGSLHTSKLARTGYERPAAKSATALARDLRDALKSNTKDDQYSLEALPVSLSREFAKTAVPKKQKSDQSLAIDTIRKYASRQTALDEIFTGHEALIRKLDAMLVTCLPLNIKYGFWEAEHLQSLGFAREEVEPHILGDIEEVVVPRETSRKASIVNTLNNLRLGLNRSHFERLAQDAKSNPMMPGVVLLGLGGKRAELTLEVIGQGFVNRLYMDTHLAAALIEKLKLAR